MASPMSSMKILVLFLLCGQNTMYTVLRRYSQGVLKENYSKVSHYLYVQLMTQLMTDHILYSCSHISPLIVVRGPTSQ
jgi:hypothetical protein